MSEPQIPHPPAPAQKKGISPLAWVLIGCFGLLLIGALGMGACGMFVAKKAGNMVENFADNPGRAMAEMAVRVNPDLELVESDDAAETVTVRDKKSGEEFTLDWSEIEKGNFKMKSGDSSFNIDASGGEDGAVITMRGEDGQQTQIFGAGGGEIPAWAPIAPGATTPQSNYAASDGKSSSGAFSYTVAGPVSEVVAFYERTLTEQGYEVSKNTFSSAGRESGMVGGRQKAGGRTVNATIGADEDGVQVTVTYSSGG